MSDIHGSLINKAFVILFDLFEEAERERGMI